MGFSKDFLWGAAAASAQIEGGWKDGGRTPSIWDMATKKQVKHGETCHTACDHYHQWKEDVALMKEMCVFPKWYLYNEEQPELFPLRRRTGAL